MVKHSQMHHVLIVIYLFTCKMDLVHSTSVIDASMQGQSRGNHSFNAWDEYDDGSHRALCLLLCFFSFLHGCFGLHYLELSLVVAVTVREVVEERIALPMSVIPT